MQKRKNVHAARPYLFISAAILLVSLHHSDVRLGGGLISLIAGLWFARVRRIMDQFRNYVFGHFVHRGLSKGKVRVARPFCISERERWWKNFVGSHWFWVFHSTLLCSIFSSLHICTVVVAFFLIVIFFEFRPGVNHPEWSNFSKISLLSLRATLIQKRTVLSLNLS